MNDCRISQQIAEHCDEPEMLCPECGEDLIEESRMDIGDFLKCSECDYHNLAD